MSEEIKFVTKLKVWRQRKNNKTYTRLIIVIPRGLRELLDEDKTYLVTITPKQ